MTLRIKLLLRAVVLFIVLVIGFVFGLYWYDILRPPLFSTRSFREEKHEPMPAAIIAKADRFIISKIDEKFFRQYVTFSTQKSRLYPANEHCIKNPSFCLQFLQKPYYLMVYSFTIPDRPFVKDQLIEFALDSSGQLIVERDVFGLPDCVREPRECKFPIDKQQALAIAEAAGLSGGIKGREAWFNWHVRYNTYIWGVSNILSDSRDEANGEELYIDANTGVVLDKLFWKSIDD
ncbi:MAG: hypothetical protein HYV42_01210 [Candidatus Magasanikbacteria bacterium]|nr:hypothetical protein [Candidatus Magasanikbacteria bacterium]